MVKKQRFSNYIICVKEKGGKAKKKGTKSKK